MDNFSNFNLHSDINKAITLCGYTKPTPVQAKSIPEILNGKDVVVSAQTGTGKTASFVLPALHNLSTKPHSKKPRVLILTPTRELASQITKAASLYGKFMRFNIVSLVGGMPYHNQIKDLSRGADILVATPGRLLDHMEQKRVDLSEVEMLVLDEADRMLDMGFIDDVQYIAKLTPSKRQTLLFSATLDNKLMNAVKHLLRNPVRIDLSSEKLASPQIKQEMYKVNNVQQKTRLLKQFLSDTNVYKAIIFTATKIHADKLADQLCDDGFAAAALHGDLRQNVRNRTLEQLRRGKTQYLVATDVAARGIDVSDITHVFNFDLPRSCEDYVHRIGRTGRAGKTGIAISFVLPNDTRQVQMIERYTGQRIKLMQNGESSGSHSYAEKRYADDDNDEVVSFRKKPSYHEEKRGRSAHSHKEFRQEKDFQPVRSERKYKSAKGDRNEDVAVSFKPKKSDKKVAGFKSEYRGKSERTFKDDGFKSERRAKPDRPFKDDGFKSERRAKPERAFKDDGFKGERRAKSDRSFKDDGFKSDRGSRSDRPFKGERKFGARPEDRSDRAGRGGKKDYSEVKEGFSHRKPYSPSKEDGRSSRPRRDSASDRAPFRKDKEARSEGSRPFKKRSITKDSRFSERRSRAK